MGFRTMVMLYNDEASKWQNNTHLGSDIYHAATNVHSGMAHFDGGQVVSCEHADTQVLSVIDSYSYRPLAFSHWQRENTNADTELQLLTQAAEKLGYKLTKKATPKND